MKLLLMLTAVFFTAGCACFPGHLAQRVDTLPPLKTGIKKSTVSYKFTYTSFGVPRGYDANHVESKYHDQFVRTLKDSGYFDSVVGQSADSDIALDVTLCTSAAVSGGTIAADLVGALSYMAIPTWKEINFTATTTAKARDGSTHTYEVADSMTLFRWIPLILASCSCSDWDIGVPGSVQRNMWRNLLLAMQKDGLI